MINGALIKISCIINSYTQGDKDMFNLNEALDTLHSYAIELDYLLDAVKECEGNAPYSLRQEISDIYETINPVADNLKSYFLRNNHGGSRPNAGRKKEEATRQVRVPESLYNLINDLKVAYKDLVEDDKEILRSSLQDIITTAQFEGIETNRVYDERHTDV